MVNERAPRKGGVVSLFHGGRSWPALREHYLHLFTGGQNPSFR